MTLKSDAKYEEKPIAISKLTRNSGILIEALKSLKDLHFDWSILCELYNIWPNRYRGVTFGDAEETCNIWIKTDVLFGKWHKEFCKFSPEHLKESKLGLSWDTLFQSQKCLSFDFTEELCADMNNDEKFEEQLTCRLKIGMKKLKNFDPSTRKSQTFALSWDTFDQSI